MSYAELLALQERVEDALIKRRAAEAEEVKVREEDRQSAEEGQEGEGEADRGDDRRPWQREVAEALGEVEALGGAVPTSGSRTRICLG